MGSPRSWLWYWLYPASPVIWRGDLTADTPILWVLLNSYIVQCHADGKELSRQKGWQMSLTVGKCQVVCIRIGNPYHAYRELPVESWASAHEYLVVLLSVLYNPQLWVQWQPKTSAGCQVSSDLLRPAWGQAARCWRGWSSCLVRWGLARLLLFSWEDKANGGYDQGLHSHGGSDKLNAVVGSTHWD